MKGKKVREEKADIPQTSGSPSASRHRKRCASTVQADIAGISVSEYIRRRFFGGTITTYTDLRTVGELRRIGGLLKHNFTTIRQANAPPDILEKQEEALRKLV